VLLPGAGSIPSGYRDVQVRIAGRTALAATNEAMALRMNGDTASSYTWSALTTSTATPTGTVPGGATSIAIGNLSSASAPATLVGNIWVDIPEYANTSILRTLVARSAYHGGGTNFQIGTFHGNWNVATALANLTVFTGSGGLFVAGSRIVMAMLP
jgi:hypothetical protein